MTSTKSVQRHKYSEKHLEKFLNKEVKKLGGKSIKMSSPNQRGVPDRLVLLPGGRSGFLELKTTGKKPTALQDHWLEEIRELGHVAMWADGEWDVLLFIKTLQED